MTHSLDNLALLYRVTGRHAEAEALYQRSLKIREQVFGPEHPEVAISLNNLAELYLVQGRYAETQGRHAEAEALYQRSLKIREQVFGPEHDVVSIMSYPLLPF